ncbi:MAG: hypothetical protein ABFS17_00700 [Chloroflexota bacterium]
MEACYHQNMKVIKVAVLEIQQSAPGKFQAVISLPSGKKAKPGQYFQAHRLKDEHAVLPITLYPGGMTNKSGSEIFTTAPPIPPTWQPGDELLLRGPLGKGFQLPHQTSRLALAALDAGCAHLLPLASQVLENGGEVALFTDHSTPHLPTQVEISPLASLGNALLWANFLAVSGTPNQVTNLKTKLNPRQELPCPAQALILIPMPCGGLGSCGVCALPGNKGKALLACEDGPVFDWQQLPFQV